MSHRTGPNPNEHMLDRARQLRRDSTIPERLLWGRLRARRLGGLKFRRQSPVGPYVVDYLCEDAKLVVELDGMSHVGQGREDDKRTEYLHTCGLLVIRITNDYVLHDLDAVCEHILNTAQAISESRRLS